MPGSIRFLKYFSHCSLLFRNSFSPRSDAAPSVLFIKSERFCQGLFSVPSLQGFDIGRGIHKKRILPPEYLRGFRNPAGPVLKIPSYESLFLYQIPVAKQQKKIPQDGFLSVSAGFSF
jgi:hypothetical protein